MKSVLYFIAILLLFSQCKVENSIHFTDKGHNLYVVPDSSIVNKKSYYKPTQSDVLYYDFMKKPPYVNIGLHKGAFVTDQSKLAIYWLDEDNNGKIDFGKDDRLGFGPFSADSILIDEINPWIFKLEAADLLVEIDNSLYRFYPTENHIGYEKLDKGEAKTEHVLYSNLSQIGYEVQQENGTSVPLSQFHTGKKPVVFDLWFMRCAGCIREFPKVNEASTSDRSDLYGLNLSDELSEIAHAKKKHELIFDQLKGQKELLKVLGNSGFYPSKLIFDKEGYLVANFGKLWDVSKIHDN